MKKITIYVFAALVSLLLTECVKDTGNYQYLDPNKVAPVLVSGIDESYSLISMGKLSVDPKMVSDETLYKYCWYAYPVNMTNVPNDTLGRERKLDYTITLPSGTYYLVFKATSKENGTAVFKKSLLTVSSIFGIGYYINKYQNGRTDLDFVDRYGVVNANILKQINGEDLPGKPIRSTYEINQYSYNVVNPDGTKTRIVMKPALMVCTDEDMRIYNGESLKLLKKWENAFLELPAVKKPQGVWAATNGFMLMNNNTVCFVNNNGVNVGEFGYPYPNNGMKLNPSVAIMSSSSLAYDDIAGELVGYHVQTYTPVKQAVLVASPLTLAPVGTAYFTNCDLIYMGTQNYQSTSAGRGYVIVKNRTTNVFYLWQIGTSNIQYGYIYDYGAGKQVIPSTFGITSGKVFAIKGGASTALNTVIYYSTGDNKVHYFNPANQTERRDMITLPAGEEITYIEHSFDNYYKINSFAVLSNKGGNWFLHVYDFEGATPDVLLPEKATYTGTGLAKNLIYRHANTALTY